MSSSCPICGTKANSAHCGLAHCAACTHVWQEDLTPTIDYKNGYAERTYATYPPDTSFLRLGYVLGRTQCSAGQSIVDVGYGNGAFLRMAKSAGLRTLGIDVHGRDAELGIEPTTFNTSHAVTVATCFDSLEHLIQPRQILQLGARHLIISVPLRPFWMLSSPRDYKHFKPGEHLHYFSGASLHELLRGKYAARDACSIEDVVRGPLRYNGDDYLNIGTFHFERQP